MGWYSVKGGCFLGGCTLKIQHIFMRLEVLHGIDDGLKIDVFFNSRKLQGLYAESLLDVFFFTESPVPVRTSMIRPDLFHVKQATQWMCAKHFAVSGRLDPVKLTWNLKVTQLEKTTIFRGVTFRFFQKGEILQAFLTHHPSIHPSRNIPG